MKQNEHPQEKLNKVFPNQNLERPNRPWRIHFNNLSLQTFNRKAAYRFWKKGFFVQISSPPNHIIKTTDYYDPQD